MESKYAIESNTHKTAGSMGVLLLLLGLLLIFTLQPPSVLESGSGMGNYKIPGSGHGGQGTTPPTTTGLGSGTTPSAGNTILPPTIVLDVLAPINDTTTNL